MIKQQPPGLFQLYALGVKRTIDLSLSENPLGCSPGLKEGLRALLVACNDYPTPRGGRLKSTLSCQLSCQPNNIFISNGSEAIINAIPRILATPGQEAIVPQLSFPMFAICSELADLRVKLAPMDQQLGIDLSAMRRMITASTKLVFVCNPNNPTGAVLSRAELQNFIQTVPRDVLVVIDEANIEFGGESVIDLISQQPNLLVLRTFSKGYGLANLRIGYAVADQNIITAMEAATPPFPVSGWSEELSIRALQDNRFLARTREFMNQQRSIMQTELQRLGFSVFPSQANNLFVKLPENISTNRFWTALQQADISVVKGSFFPGFDDRYFRLSPRLEKINLSFLTEVKKIVRPVGAC